MQESQTKVTQAVQSFFDAQIAIQKDVFAAATAGFQGVLALERAGLKAAARAAEASAQYAKATTETLPTTVKTVVSAIPLVDAQMAEKLSAETAATLAQIRATAEKGALAAREAATVATKQYEAFLSETETRGMEAMKAAEQTAAETTIVVRDVTKGAVESAYAAVDKAATAAKTMNPAA